MGKEILRVQAHALGLFSDEMVNTFDPDALILGGGVLETRPEFQRWFLAEIRLGCQTSGRSRQIFLST
jgi:predicted NBD/HSP70 family sugar kinase